MKELLNNTQGSATFSYRPAPQCGVLAGITHRAVYFAYDKANIYEFFRNYRNVTIVTGSGDYNTAAAERLATALGP